MTTHHRTLSDIRQTFLGFFAKNGHTQVKSSPLVPYDDPTLLFVNAGMVQFKNRFTGLEKGSYNRATSSQKCVRAGGKHNDLDNVGYTARHHTFFEMLGNFSFGDYFKEDAIKFAWDLLTQEFGLNPDKLLVTVYHTDEEAVNIWKKVAGFSDNKIIRINTNDNFWSMGDTGPCGPCSEIFYDHGDHIAGGPPGSADEDGDRFIEIWNLVFMQYERHKDGTQTDLPAPSIDTGMGLERFSALMQGKHDNYDTDLMRSIIDYSADITKTNPDGEFSFSHRILADHLRSTGFLIADGVLPSNEGRGYVLRRIMRRAMRHAHIIGTTEPLMHRLVPILIETMGKDYPELVTAQTLMETSFLQEEESFRRTLTRGLDLLTDSTKNMIKGDILSGDTAFKLYDTYGFPLDLTQDILRAKDIKVDVAGFDDAMTQQKQMARLARDTENHTHNEALWLELGNVTPPTEFTGYTEGKTEQATILALVQDGLLINSASSGFVDIICDKTSFYAESGGQIGDTGFVYHDTVTIEITDCIKKAGKFHVMRGEIINGTCQIGDVVTTEINSERRLKIRANHSATHLLHEALRRILGDSVTQKGSMVSEERLRFDFSYTKALTQTEIKQVETLVNSIIRQNHGVNTEILTPDEARKRGALALFGEKYGDNVRVLFMGKPDTNTQEFSIELCGGTHVNALGDIGCFVIETEAGVSSGIRRIEALTGQTALDYLGHRRETTDNLSEILKTPVDDICKRVMTLIDDKKHLERDISDLKKKLASGGNVANSIETIHGIKFIGKIVDGLSPKELAGLIDEEKQKLVSGIVTYIAINDGKVGVAVGVTKDLTDTYNAVDLAKIASLSLGGKGGGGRPDFAQAGGTDSTQAEQAIANIKAVI